MIDRLPPAFAPGARVLVLGLACLGLSSGARADSSVTWDWILSGRLPSPPPVVDYLDTDAFDTPADFVAAAKANGTTAICYISAGTLENWRPDRRAFRKLDRKQRRRGNPLIIGRKYPDWPDERWLNFARYKVFLPLMVKRMKRCRSKGFDMIEFDNLDGYANRTGFKIRKRHAVRYARALARKATRIGLVPIQKNAPELAGRLQRHFGALLLEDCALYDFCGDAVVYRAAGKLVFDAEYPEAWSDEGKPFDLDAVCATTDAADISLIVKSLDLDKSVQRCP
ncbi:endo alpha-1,4 polygalactosaminidase [Microbaculum sp. FT89]|uniref:endo alpha-1,4 polygalactosaminidase n=1 Tax=Microbaculum sp. FT89 TaxID=3447298 RepID=UPI003F53B6C8